jgi:hypothetical protein
MQTSYIDELNRQMKLAIEQKEPFFLKDPPFYIENPLSVPRHFIGKQFTLPNQVLLHCHNQNTGHNFTQYVPINAITDQHLHWFDHVTEKNQELGALVSQPNETGEFRLQIVMPVKNLNQNEYKDDYTLQKPLPDIRPIQISKNEYKNIEDYLTTKLANYFNAAMTHTSIVSESFPKDKQKELIYAINTDPHFVIRCSTNAYKEIRTNQTYVQEQNAPKNNNTHPTGRRIA